MRWFLFNRTQSGGGNGNGSESSGPGYLNASVVAEENRPSPVAFEGLFCEWRSQSPLARPQNPWRTEDARDCYIGAHRLAGSPDDSFAPAVSDLEDISAQSPWRDRVR